VILIFVRSYIRPWLAHPDTRPFCSSPAMHAARGRRAGSAMNVVAKEFTQYNLGRIAGEEVTERGLHPGEADVIAQPGRGSHTVSR
jgi:hypothetical protein